MNWSLEGFLWVVPGIVFLFSYNRLRDVETVEFSGWPYVFFIVLVGTITYLPIREWFGPNNEIQVLVLSSFMAFLIPFAVKYSFSFFVKRLEENENFFIPSFFWSLMYFFYPLEIRDKFIKNCLDYEGEEVLITTDEPLLIKVERGFQEIKTTLFFGILVEFPYVATSVTESHVIRILPLLSGYWYVGLNCKTKKIKWVQKHEVSEDSEGIIIPRNRIIRMSRYKDEVDRKMVFGDQ